MTKLCRGVAQLVARLVWDQDAAGSSPVTSTKREGNPFGLPFLFIVCDVLLEPGSRRGPRKAQSEARALWGKEERRNGRDAAQLREAAARDM